MKTMFDSCFEELENYLRHYKSMLDYYGKAIILWNFEDAPIPYKKLSPHGGDEDYIFFVPEGINNPWFLDYRDTTDELDYQNSWGFGSCHKVDGGHIWIYAHA